MKQLTQILLLAAGLAGGTWLVPDAGAQVLPLEIRQDAIRYNLRKTNGLPISTIANVPPGSDGRGPTLAQQQAAGLTELAATTNQFRGFVAFGASTRPVSTLLNSNLSLAANAENVNLPRIKLSNQVAMILLRGRVAAPYLGRTISFDFGEVVSRPEKDEYGVLLSVVNTNVTPNRPVTTPEAYWLAEPYTTNNHTNAGYYWSPHAQKVFAANSGPLFVPWRRSVSSTNANPPADVRVVLVLGLPYVVATNQYFVSGSPVKKPRMMYWTERTFADTGKPVTVPSARVGAVNFVYNNNVPERVPAEIEIPGSAPIVTSNALQEVRTLWFDQMGGQAGGQIRAYNVEGRVFMELLGDVTGLNTRQHLGFEIVDLIRQPAPSDVTIELGEKLTSYPGGVPDDSDLFPEPLFAIGESYIFQHNPNGRARPDLYATRETLNLNDLQVHWLEDGLEGLRWPFRFARYKLIWPEKVSKYSHYIRPLVATEIEAKATAVPLPSQNAPFIAYQDPLDQPRGKLTENFAYYSYLDTTYPAHRALLRFTAGEFVRFERVFSWLDQGVREFGLTQRLFISDFETLTANAHFYGNAYISNGVLHLTDALFNQNSSYILDDFVGVSVQNFRATFRANVGNGTLVPADGISFNFGTIANGQLPGEEGIADGLVVSWDIYDNGPGDLAPSISIKRNGITIAAVTMAETRNPEPDPGNLPVPTDPATGQPMTIATGNQFVPVEIVLRSGGLMDVSYKGVKVLGNIATGYTPRTGRFGLGGRAGGGANSANWIDDLFITVNEETKPPTFANSVMTNITGFGRSPGFTIRNTRVNFGTIGSCDLGAAETLLARSTTVFSRVDPIINHINTGPDAHFPNNLSYPGFAIGIYEFNFVTEATSTIVIPSSGFWTFGVSSDDGFKCDIGANSFSNPNGSETAVLATFFLEAGQYPVRLIHFECGEGANLEFFAAAGNHTNFHSSFRLVGDTAGGGLEAWVEPPVSISARPRVVNTPVFVGDRIGAPAGELGSGFETDYLAGYIHQAQGNLFNPAAYVDPFSGGFDEANRGAIIPVNVMPTNHLIEVLWFRKNAVNTARGFLNSYWPAVIGRYTVQYPNSPAEIVLASNDGSGPLVSLQAGGNIYYQNDRSLPGFNPNEEHALMQGGQAFALRDDLNVTNVGSFTSLPFVLLNYTESDGRPAMRAFKVLREKPGTTFDFALPAGAVLQPPMPLPLLEKPLAPSIAGQAPMTLNTEISSYTVSASSSAAAGAYTRYSLTTSTRHFAKAFEPLALQNGTTPANPVWFFPTNVAATTLGGWVCGLRPLELKASYGEQNTNGTSWRFVANLPTSLVASGAPALLFNTVTTNAPNSWMITVTEVNTNAQYVEVNFGTSTPPAAQNANVLVLTVAGPGGNAFASQRLAPEPLPNAVADSTLRNAYGRFTLQDRKGNVWIYRGPHVVGETPSLVMQFYYKTLPGFFFPSLPLNAQPPTGTITPYLRPLNPNGTYAGDPVYGNVVGSAQTADGNALGIIYRPVWPDNVPVLEMAETLTTTRRGLPAVRGQTSLEVVYQQSHIGGGTNAEAVVLHDPIREKAFALGTPGNGSKLDGIPDSVNVQNYIGKIFFPNLPPHLSERFFYDPNRGASGELVFKGQFVDAPLGDDFLFLNVLGDGDLAELKALCIGNDSKKAFWDAAIDGLSTTLLTYIENPAQPGTFIPGTGAPNAPVPVGAGAIARIRNDEVAVDSYALTATGPGVGYISLLAGDGRAFTPDADPVSVHVVKVVNTLYRGEVNIVESSNPLNETLTLQQSVDLAAKIEDYRFEWKIASPVNGLPPMVYSNSRVILLGSGSWTHLRFPLSTDTGANVVSSAASRVVNDVTTGVIPGAVTVSPVSRITYTGVSVEDEKFKFRTPANPTHGLVAGNKVALRKTDGAVVFGVVHGFTTPTDVYVTLDPNQSISVATNEISELSERVLPNQTQSIVFRQFTRPLGNYSQYWLGMDLDPALGAKVYIDGQLVVKANTADADTPTTAAPAGLVLYTRPYQLSAADLAGGTLNLDGTRTHTIAVELISSAVPAQLIAFNLRLEAFSSSDVTGPNWLPLEVERYPDGVRAVLGGSADVRSLADNYIIMRYQPKNSGHASFVSNAGGSNTVWSLWTTPQLAEGWIKRVLRGINPFNQRITDLFNNSVNTDVSIVSQAGGRWEGDVALNLDNLNNAGLIEIYETILNRGKNLSISGGINYGPANDALLLAAGYLNDLYMVLGNEAWADASNPTIGIGTKDNTYGAIASALFSFKGQLPSLLEEELALMRGRDHSLLPGVELRPVYNRMVWNYTRGIDSGEVIYALNYNILDQNTDGVVDAKDAQKLFPQGHGDAYGHYLSALKGYYSLLLDNNFDWVPRTEAVTILGRPVSVDYQDERKFAAAAAAVARAGRQVFDLTWRRDFKAGGKGWAHFEAAASGATSQSVPVMRYWSMDHWASRTGQGAYLSWVVGNTILPDVDPDPSHIGTIQQVDRSTVPELRELTSIAESLQTALDNAESGHTPLGLPSTTIPFDLNPNSIVGSDANTHFEQIYTRAKRALNNAIAAFDDAKDVTRLMRSEQDSLADFRTTVNKQELAYTNALIELYGTPYPEDIGPGKTYRTGFSGPDMLHYMYVDTPELTFAGPQGTLLDPAADVTWTIDTQTFQPGWAGQDLISTFGWIQPAFAGEIDGTGRTEDYLSNTNLFITYNLSSHGFFKKPTQWTGRRLSPGKLQQAISDVVKARNAVFTAFYWADAAKYDLDWAIRSLDKKVQSQQYIYSLQRQLQISDAVLESSRTAYEIADKILEKIESDIEDQENIFVESIPKSLIVGLAAGGDIFSVARAAAMSGSTIGQDIIGATRLAAFTVFRAFEGAATVAREAVEVGQIAPEEFNQELRDAVSEVRDKVYGMNNNFMTINQRLQELDDAQRKYRALLAEGDRIQEERQIFRQRAAAVIQGYRTRDAAFRIFRNEKLERYKTLFDLSSQYAFMAAQAYDYETGLLGTETGKDFISRIVRSRALGIVHNGEPQFAGSATGDPGLSSAMAEMFADWSVAKGRLGFNNPDGYGTTLSLRTENFRILPGTNSDTNRKDILHQARKANILDDPDVRRYCLQIDPGNGLPVPGLVIEFSTTIDRGLNLFGQSLAAGDHAYSPSSFATKIFAAGIALEGYLGMDDPAANSGTGGASPPDPDLAFLDPNAMAATPYIYLVPVGVDSMRSPALGDTGEVRTWSVDDVAIPLPFNIGGSEFSTAQLYQSSDSLSEEPFAIRKHQAFRPVSSSTLFSPNIYSSTGGLTRSQWTNNRLVGRSVWNSKWKLVIPGETLLNNPDEGLERFIRTVKDVKIHFITYSYSGN